MSSGRTSVLIGRELSIDRRALGMIVPVNENVILTTIVKATTWSKLIDISLNCPVIRPLRGVESLGAEGSDEGIAHSIQTLEREALRTLMLSHLGLKD